MQAYSDQSRESETYSLPDLEVFYVSETDGLCNEDGELLEAGWYYWYCFPGCLPDSEPIGPFESEREALVTAREEFND
jgi:hypothetical protein